MTDKRPNQDQNDTSCKRSKQHEESCFGKEYNQEDLIRSPEEFHVINAHTAKNPSLSGDRGDGGEFIQVKHR